MSEKKIGKLSAWVMANTAPFEKSLKGAQGHVRAFTSSISNSGSLIFNKFTALGGLLGVGLGVHSLKGIAESIDTTSKLSQKLGVTTEALVGLQHGAKLAGLDVESFNGSLVTLAKNVGLASMGQGKAKDALASLGFDAKKLAQVSPENQLKAIADAMKSIENPTEKVALAMKIFGSQGADLMPFLADGAAGIEAMQQDAEKLGLTFSGIDGSKVEAANDALSRVQATFEGLAQTLVIQLSPYITAAADAFTDWATSGTSGAEMIVSGVEWVAQGIAYVADTIDLVSIGWSGFKFLGLKAFEVILNGVVNLIEGLHDLTDFFDSILPTSVSQGLDNASNSVKKFANGITAAAGEAGAEFDSKMLAQSSSDKVANFFAQVRSKAQAEAEKVNKDKGAKPQLYDNALYKSTRNMTSELEKQLDIKEKIANVGTNNSLIRAGSAAAQGFSGKSFAVELVKAMNKSIDTENKQLEVLNKIARKQDQNDGPDVIDDF